MLKRGSRANSPGTSSSASAWRTPCTDTWARWPTWIPAREEFILDMDTKHRVITVRLPEGLLDLDDAEEI